MREGGMNRSEVERYGLRDDEGRRRERLIAGRTKGGDGTRVRKGWRGGWMKDEEGWRNRRAAGEREVWMVEGGM